jgi:hypothetical protein
MPLWGEYTMHCAVCAKVVQVRAGGQPMTRTRSGMACTRECADELEMRDARSVLGEDTPPEGTEKWQAGR